MEFRDLKQQYQVLKQDMDAAMQEVTTNCNFISGKQVSELEGQLADYVGTKHCITCANGTDALTLMMMAWGIGPGDAVFVPDFTFFSTGEIVSFVGAIPVFVDVRADTYNMDSQSLKEAIVKVENEGKLKPKAVIPVDLFGQPAEFDEICKIAKEHGLMVLEDGAQGFGGKIGARVACSFSDAGTTSFFPSKPLGCYGDGGAIFTDDDDVAAFLQSARVHGKGSFKYDNIRIGMNSRLDTIQAAVLQIKLKAFRDYELDRVNQVAEMYSARLKDHVQVPHILEGFYSSWAQYTIQLHDEAERTRIQERLKEKGIPSMVFYPKPMHMQKAFSGVTSVCACPVTEHLCKSIMQLPIHPYLTEETVELISNEVIAALNDKERG